ncbi:hypothetical protein PORCAN_2207 [Porphyromonas crevioricanis JCM 13913]|nr:hypothetical protein PORCAN_2207 [Porphyromonas crevioricanis JCM 13913]
MEVLFIAIAFSFQERAVPFSHTVMQITLLDLKMSSIPLAGLLLA